MMLYSGECVLIYAGKRKGIQDARRQLPALRTEHITRSGSFNERLCTVVVTQFQQDDAERAFRALRDGAASVYGAELFVGPSRAPAGSCDIIDWARSMPPRTDRVRRLIQDTLRDAGVAGDAWPGDVEDIYKAYHRSTVATRVLDAEEMLAMLCCWVFCHGVPRWDGTRACNKTSVDGVQWGLSADMASIMKQESMWVTYLSPLLQLSDDCFVTTADTADAEFHYHRASWGGDWSDPLLRAVFGISCSRMESRLGLYLAT
jgi:hypothetical protein